MKVRIYITSMKSFFYQEKRKNLTGVYGNMIEVTKLNGAKILMNSDLIEIVEETPDTMITLTTGRKIIVKESRHDIENLVKLYKREILCNIT